MGLQSDIDSLGEGYKGMGMGLS